MIARVFIDTNIWVYGFIKNEKKKHQKVLEVLSHLQKHSVFVSVQVLSEVYSALSKLKVAHGAICSNLTDIEAQCNIASISLNTVKKSLAFKEKYGFSYWDSLIASSAIENSCFFLLSEDLQHNQILEKKLRILNPFSFDFDSLFVY